ncbi:MAG: cysteine--tRNA ligase [Lentisphaerae bacterium]|nr:cysteine--tRNA ligase [Lentisphaerota bacterium]
MEDDHVRMYTCGPTVYDFAHVGNFRAYMFEDILRRTLKLCGFRVTQVMNITDIDDKTIRGATAAGVSLTEYTSKYTQAFFEDLDALGIERAEHYPAATDHIPEMVDLVQRLLDGGCAYRSDDGSVYFDLSRFEAYGRLARLDREGLKSGARVAQDEYDKENVADFALWKAWDENDGDVVWDAPWGRGRPGWHIECSAMSMKYLGESFDVHTGGVDNMFPHHENEIAQSEAATGKPFVKYWMHCGYLVVDGGKMSKSLGNFYTLRQVMEKGYTGREIRYVLMSCQYRQQLNFSLEACEAAKASLERLVEFRARVALAAGETAGGTAPAWAVNARDLFKTALEDDLNVPEALGALFDMVHEGNRGMDGGELDPGEAAGVLGVLETMDSVLGVLKAEEAGGPGQEVEALVEHRRQARADKAWAESDRLRDEIAALGWEVRDTPNGQKLKRIRP